MKCAPRARSTASTPCARQDHQMRVAQPIRPSRVYLVFRQRCSSVYQAAWSLCGGQCERHPAHKKKSMQILTEVLIGSNRHGSRLAEQTGRETRSHTIRLQCRVGIQVKWVPGRVL